MLFGKLDDSPMFRQQIQCLEESAESLRGRCLKLYKGCRKYTEGLGEGYVEDIAFANALENFGRDNDPDGVAFGGPVMNKFIFALREVGTYKDVLRSQVEHMLNDRLLHFVNVDLHDVKENRKRFEKASLVYDQAREKFLSLRKSTKLDVAAVIEEELRNARSQYEQARFNLVTALSRVEAKKKFEFLEAVTGTMDAHFRFFKQGYELLHQIEPFINQVLSYAQQSRESSNCEQTALRERMEEYRRQIDLESRHSLSGSPRGDGMQPFSRNSHKIIDAVMQSSEKGKVQIIRQGYLSKRSSNLRGDWKRRFFVLDSRGMLYYYRKQCSWSSGSGSQSYVHRSNSPENGSGLLSRWLSSHYHGGVHDEKTAPRHTVNLLTSTIKVDADQTDLRFCFRIISPLKNYTLQAENALDQMDWIEKITGAIASLLSSQTSERRPSASTLGSTSQRFARESGPLASYPDALSTAIEDGTLKNIATSDHLQSRNIQQEYSVKSEKPIDVLRRVSGNDKCADCGAAEPDWASLNLGVLICIECSGVHRNLGVQISKVRSLTLDVKVWDTSVLTLFQSLGNTYANSIWEELFNSSTVQADGSPMNLSETDKHQQFRMRKPKPDDPIQIKEFFIHAKYEEKIFVRKMKENQNFPLVAQKVWQSVRANDKKTVYRHVVNSDAVVNEIQKPSSSCQSSGKSSCYFNSSNKSDDQLTEECPNGCSLLHLACQTADIGMVELLLQYGASINAPDSRGQTPLHHCIIRGRTAIAKLLLTRGADPHAVDGEGITPLQLVSVSSVRDDDEILALLGDTRRLSKSEPRVDKT